MKKSGSGRASKHGARVMKGVLERWKKLRNERAQRRLQQGTARLALEKGDASGKKSSTLMNICFGYGDRQLLSIFQHSFNVVTKLA